MRHQRDGAFLIEIKAFAEPSKPAVLTLEPIIASDSMTLEPEPPFDAVGLQNLLQRAAATRPHDDAAVFRAAPDAAFIPSSMDEIHHCVDPQAVCLMGIAHQRRQLHLPTVGKLCRADATVLETKPQLLASGKRSQHAAHSEFERLVRRNAANRSRTLGSSGAAAHRYGLVAEQLRAARSSNVAAASGHAPCTKRAFARFAGLGAIANAAKRLSTVETALAACSTWSRGLSGRRRRCGCGCGRGRRGRRRSGRRRYDRRRNGG